MRLFVWISSLIWFTILHQATYVLGSSSSSSQSSVSSDAAYRDDYYRNTDNTYVNRSQLLIEVLDSFNKSGYDSRIRPNFNNNVPEEIQVQMFVTELGPFDAEEMVFNTEMMFRTYWTDERLRWNASGIYPEGSTNNITQAHLELPDSMYDDFWKPDLYFRNSAEAFTHEVTQHNRLLFIDENGGVTQSERIKLTSHCFFNLQDYPFDNQNCSFQIESYKYSETDIRLRWHQYPMFMAMTEMDQPNGYKSQWFLAGNPSNTEKTILESRGNYTRLLGEFKVGRQYTYALVQTYVPSILVVIMSIVGFWIDNEDAIDRMALTVTVILTLTTMQEGIRDGLPKVSYLKAIDTWMLVCTFFCYMALFQSAWVHYILRCGKKESDVVCPENDDGVDGSSSPRRPNMKINYYHLRQNTPAMAQHYAMKVNLYSKIAFPACFAAFNIVYWAWYMKIYNDCRWWYICSSSGPVA